MKKSKYLQSGIFRGYEINKFGTLFMKMETTKSSRRIYFRTPMEWLGKLPNVGTEVVVTFKINKYPQGDRIYFKADNLSVNNVSKEPDTNVKMSCEVIKCLRPERRLGGKIKKIEEFVVRDLETNNQTILKLINNEKRIRVGDEFDAEFYFETMLDLSLIHI